VLGEREHETRKAAVKMVSTPRTRGEYASFPQPEWWLKEEAIAAHFIEHAPGLQQYYATRGEAFHQIEEDALARHPNPTPEAIAAAEAAEAALPSRKRTEIQLRRSFEPLATHLPSAAKRRRKGFIQRAQRQWNKANPTPLTAELRRTLAAEFRMPCVGPNRS
jgi:hypothetical protein